MHQRQVSNFSQSFSPTLKQQKIINAFFQTLSYSDIFSYPLTGKQLFEYLPIRISRQDFLIYVSKLPYQVAHNTFYYFLPGHKKLVTKRLQREKISQKKKEKVVKVARLLGLFPTILSIGISGSLAMQNTDNKSDSDLFFITKPHTLWITRCFVYLVLFVLGLKRSDKKTKSAICANMFVDSNYLVFPLSKRNIYIAHEIYQVIPVVNKKNTHEKLLLANKWITTFFPNIALPKKIKKQKDFSFAKLFFPIEYIFYILQKWYMRDKITRETVSLTTIAFHPVDYESEILLQYNKKIKKYAI